MALSLPVENPTSSSSYSLSSASTSASVFVDSASPTISKGAAIPETPVFLTV